MGRGAAANSGTEIGPRLSLSKSHPYGRAEKLVGADIGHTQYVGRQLDHAASPDQGGTGPESG